MQQCVSPKRACEWRIELQRVDARSHGIWYFGNPNRLPVYKDIQEVRAYHTSDRHQIYGKHVLASIVLGQPNKCMHAPGVT
jgi:hypothetical protein